MNFDSFNFDQLILTNINALGYKTPTPIQSKSFPPILEGKDVMGLAQTGTGKTAAFTLPLLQHLIAGKRSCVRALIIAPTRELAQQIHEAITKLAHGTGLRSMTLYGGVSVKSQLKNLQLGYEIVVACPGRLLDHLQQKTINLQNVEALVLDEADQMFDMGFFPSIRKILRFVPKKRQTLLFSATMPGPIRELARDILNHPVTIEIGQIAPATSVKQTLFPIAQNLKSELLIKILRKTEIQSVLVFTRTKRGAKQVASKLEQAGFRATSLQGNLSQNKRQSAMTGFRDGSLQIIVATDIASRGIDVPSISHVINYDMPDTVEAYIHRIGRTGRATKLGEAYTLITHDDSTQIRNIERVLGNKLEQCKLDDFDYAATPPPRHPTFVERRRQTPRQQKPRHAAPAKSQRTEN